MYNEFRKNPEKFEDDMKSGFQVNHKNYLKFKVALGKLFKTWMCFTFNFRNIFGSLVYL